MLAPEGYGEIIGGSQREDDLHALLEPIKEEGLNEAEYAWHLNLRRFSTVHHDGFGLGVERTLAWLWGWSTFARQFRFRGSWVGFGFLEQAKWSPRD